MIQGHHKAKKDRSPPGGNNNILPKLESNNNQYSSNPGNSSGYTTTMSESWMDVSLLDMMGIEEFLSVLKNKTETSSKNLWRASCNLAIQLKASRELLSVGSSLLSSKLPGKRIIDRLVDATYIILSAERVHLLELYHPATEGTQEELVVTHSREEQSIGMRIPVSRDIAGEVFQRKSAANIPDVSTDSRFTGLLDFASSPTESGNHTTAGNSKTKSLLCVPVIVDGVALGVLQATNKMLPTNNNINNNSGSGSGSSPTDGSDLTTVVGAAAAGGGGGGGASFSLNDVLLLNFIAHNIGLALKMKAASARTGAACGVSGAGVGEIKNGGIMVPSPRGTPEGSASASDRSFFYSSPPSDAQSKLRSSPSFSSSASSEQDSKFQHLIEIAYDKLDAERVSIFTYSATSKTLVCTVSPDIKGFSIPPDKGIAGIAFTTLRVINVSDVKDDTRHFKEVDNKAGYTTRNLLCAPIVDPSGCAIGVIQAINKRSGSNFNNLDEEEILNVCKNLCLLLKEKALLEKKAAAAASAAVSAGDGALLTTTGASPKTPSRSSSPGIGAGRSKSESPSGGSGGGGVGGSVGAALARAITQLISASTVEELTWELERGIKSFVDCDFAALYTIDNEDLVRIKGMSAHTIARKLSGGGGGGGGSGGVGIADSTGTGGGKSSRKNSFGKSPGRASGGSLSSMEDRTDVTKLRDIPLQIKQALQFNSTVEFKKPAFIAGDACYFLPSLSINSAVIIPFSAKAYGFQPGKCLIVVANTTTELILSSSARRALDAYVEAFNKAMWKVCDRLAYEDSVTALKENFLLVNNTLGALQDFVILLDSNGNLVACNKMLEDLLGGGSGGEGKSKAGAEAGSAARPIADGSHFSSWLTSANSSEMCTDVASAVKLGRASMKENVMFSSPKHPDGLLLDYQVSPIENPEAKARAAAAAAAVKAGLAPVAEAGKPVRRRSMTGGEGLSPFTGEIDSSTSGGGPFPVVLVIQVLKKNAKRNSYSEGFLQEIARTKQLDTSSAHGVVEAATSILSHVRNSYDIDAATEETLKNITQSLADTSRRLSIANVNMSAINSAMFLNQAQLIPAEAKIPADVFEWEFNVLNISDGVVLCSIIGKLFNTLFDLDALGVDRSTLAKYIMEVAKHYHDRPFHNIQHATGVTHFTYMLIKNTEAESNLKMHQVFAILVSALVHDVDHPGNTNLFEINSNSELAIRYNDQSVLENHHCSTAFRLMRKPHMQVLNAMAKAERTEIRRIVISCVMATDMAVHFELIDETKKRANEGWNFGESKDQALLGKILLHAADLSNPVRPFHMTRQWAERISIEFNDQVAREQALGMPVLGFMMTPDEKAFCKNETGFASFVVAPMWRSIALVYPNLNFLVEQLDANLVTWRSLLEKIQAEESVAAALAAAAAVVGGSETLDTTDGTTTAADEEDVDSGLNESAPTPAAAAAAADSGDKNSERAGGD